MFSYIKNCFKYGNWNIRIALFLVVLFCISAHMDAVDLALGILH